MVKKKKIYKVGIDSETYAISLVESPAIEETLVALEEQKPIKIQLADEEKYMVYSAVLVPDKPIYRRNEDGDEFYIEFTKESIEKMAQEYLMNYRQNEITLDHETMANDITLVESWIKTDMYKDKSVAIGLSEDLPIGTWIAGLKVNQIDAWNRIKNGELKGFSVESMISLEEFSKQEQNTNNMTIETNDNMFWDKMKNILSEVFTSLSMSKKVKEPTIEELAANSGFTNVEEYENEVETIKTELEEENAAEQAVEPTVEPTVEEPVVEETPKAEEPKPQEAVEEKPKEDVSKLEELISNLKNEIEALKTMNSGLEERVKEMSKQPSTNPVNTNAKPSAGDTYSAWREQLRNMIR